VVEDQPSCIIRITVSADMHSCCLCASHIVTKVASRTRPVTLHGLSSRSYRGVEIDDVNVGSLKLPAQDETFTESEVINLLFPTTSTLSDHEPPRALSSNH
jgi:hypothetical protein